jgi:DNA repair exonuclease SbcCD nuclease subunit
MSAQDIRVLLVADTHLGFDLPFRPRVERRRRGHDFFANFERALAPALRGDVDLVVHGGDLFYRSRVPPALVDMAMAPLVRVAEAGTPVYLVPGNHERSRIPLHLWTAHPNLHIFHRPTTFMYHGPKGSLALSGFPFARKVRDRLGSLLDQTGYTQEVAVPRLLCLHQTIEGAQVGVTDYTFRRGVDIIRGRDVPPGFSAVLCGHIHRAQVLSHDLSGWPLAAPVIYPGSIERTSFAERDEEKGYYIVSVSPRAQGRAGQVDTKFVPLPTRPMISLVFEPGARTGSALEQQLEEQLAALDPDSVVRVQLSGQGAAAALRTLTAARLRQIAPPSMNVVLAGSRTHGEA